MSYQPTRSRAIRWLLGLTLLAGLASTATAQQPRRVHVGVRGGGNFEYSDPAVGAHVSVPIGRDFDLYPSFDAYFPERGSRLGFNADFKYRIPTNTKVKFYTGAGVGMIRREIDNFDEHHWGANVLGGIETTSGWRVHPFLESRVMFYDRTSVGLAAGLNLTVGK